MVIQNVCKQINIMRSLIKMEMSRYPVFDVVPLNQLPFKQQNVRRNGVATHQGSRNQSKVQALYGAIKKQQQGSFLQCDSAELYRISSKPKKSIDKYVSALANEIQNPRQQTDLSQSKFKMLKRIIQHYDIKNMQKNDYSKLIKTFGLKIETARTTQKKNQSRQKSRNFTIKPSRGINSSRLQKLKNRMDNQSQVALFQFSKELKPEDLHNQRRTPAQKCNRSKFLEKDKTFFDKDHPSRRLQVSTSKDKRKLQTRGIAPFKYQSKQDIIKQKVNKYRQFLFALNLSNGLHRDLGISQYEKPLKYYVGRGNNSNLIKFLMKKRYWYEQTNKIKEANFVWTQIKNQSVFQSQKDTQKKQQQKEKEIKTKLKRPVNIKILNSSQVVQQNFTRILSKKDLLTYQKINESSLRKHNMQFVEKLKYSNKKINFLCISEEDKVHNHISSNGLLGNKKGMFYSLRQYYQLKNKHIFDVVPITFHICKGILDEEFKKFNAFYQQRKKKKLQNVWIMKPGQFSNRGQGITCSNQLDDIKKRVMKCKSGNQKKGQARTLILQLYITNPLLYNNRKFDIRVFMLTTIHNGKIKAYWYQEGYIRTSSYAFDLNQITDNDIHLTNDAIQKCSDKYGKYEPANKLSFQEFQRYLDGFNGRNLDFFSTLLPKMKEIGSQAIKSSFLFLDRNRKQHNFELFGLDFMVDYNFKPWLIEINTNPCLELSCPLLERIVPHMLENALRIGLDPIFPPSDIVPHNYKYTIAENAVLYNKFELIFDEDRDGGSIKREYEKSASSSEVMMSLMGIQQDQQQYVEEGVQVEEYDV